VQPTVAHSPLLLSLVLTAGVLALLSRFLIFESTYTVLAADFGNGIHWISWLLGTGLPLLVAVQLLAARGTAAWALALAGGLAAGAALSQLDLVLASGAYFRTPESSEVPGPGWWATLVSAVVLIVCVVVALRQTALSARPGVRSDWRAVGGVLLVSAGLAAWLTELSEAWPWLTYNEPGLLLAAACLPVALLDLDPAQRLFGLAAVTVLGSWVASGPVRALIIGNYPIDAQATTVALVSVFCSVAGCYLAQTGRGRASRGATASLAGRR
jgi:hypothetical protein